MASPLRLHNVCDVPLEVKLPEAPLAVTWSMSPGAWHVYL